MIDSRFDPTPADGAGDAWLAQHASVEEAFRYHYVSLLQQAERRLGSRQDAEDAVQEGFERAFKGYAGFGINGDYRVGAWLSRIVRNVCVDRLEGRERERHLVDRVGRLVEPDLDPASSVADPPVLREVRSALASLPTSQRDAWILRELDGLEYAAVAEAAGISEVNARARVSRARGSLRARLSRLRASVACISGPGLVAWAASRARRATSHGDHVASGAAGAPGASQMASQLELSAYQVATSPVAQSVISAGGSVRGLVATAAAAATIATGAAVATGSASPQRVVTTSVTTPAALGTPPAVGPDVSSSLRPVVGATPPTTATPSTTSTTSMSGAVTSVPVHAGPPATVTSVKVAPTPAGPSWLLPALVAGGDSGSDGSRPSTPASGSTSTPASGLAGTPGPSTPTTVTTTTVPPPAPSCPWISPQLSAPPPAPASSSVAATIVTPSVDLTSVGSTPAFAIGTGMTQAGISAASAVFVEMEACTPPVSAALRLTIESDNETAVATGALVDTVGTDAEPGYLFRGEVVPGGSGMPGGLTGSFVAQLAIDRAANTAQLTVAFLTDPGITAP